MTSEGVSPPYAALYSKYKMDESSHSYYRIASSWVTLSLNEQTHNIGNSEICYCKNHL